jgi:hypothetical protein
VALSFSEALHRLSPLKVFLLKEEQSNLMGMLLWPVDLLMCGD